ncbi:MAG: carbon-nitrogen hydrolase family protein [Waddliaceae bacterium]
MIRVAAYQANPKAAFPDRKRQIHDILAKADIDCIDFLCFPEGFLTGYYADESLARKNSFEVQSPVFQEWLVEISRYRVTIIIGFNEKDGNKLFDSVAAIENGKLVGIQRKHYLYHDYFTAGTTFSCWLSKEVPFGIIVCLDSNYFEPSRLLALQGATILFCPMCNIVPLEHPYAKRPPYYSHFIARSHENRCWLVAADWILANDQQSICPGHSSIYDPDGREVLRARELSEDFLIVDIPKERLFQDKGRRVHGSQPLTQALYNRLFNINAPKLPCI